MSEAHGHYSAEQSEAALYGPALAGELALHKTYFSYKKIRFLQNQILLGHLLNTSKY